MKKISKTLLILAAGACTAVSVGLFAACGDEPTAHTHDYGDWAVTKPTADGEGYAVKTCGADGCDQKTVTVTLPALGDSGYTLSGDTATCEAGGEATYTYSKDGNTVSFTAATAATGHIHLQKTDEEPKSCTEDGVAAYWTCSCGKMFSDANAENEIEEPVVIPASHAEDLFHHEATPATCGAKGTGEYWLCLDCYQKFSDEDGENEIETVPTTEIDPDAHLPLEHVNAIPASCTAAGTVEYWYCPGCLQKYGDAEGEKPISEPASTPAAHGTLIHEDAVEATCMATGAEEYWYCEDCNQKFSDAAGTTKIAKAAETPQKAHTPGAVVSGTKGGSVTLPTGTQTITQNNIDYYPCEVCGKMFADAACTLEVTNPAKYATRGGGVLTQGNNVMYNVTGSLMMVYFQAEETGCYAFTLDNCTIVKVYYFADAEDTNTGVGVYSSGWYQNNKYIDRFSKSTSETTLSNIVYADMLEGEILYLAIEYTKSTLYGVNVQKAEGENILVLGNTDISVTANDVQEGVEYVFTASADGFYQITIPEDSIAYVMTEKNGSKTAVLSAGEEMTSYVFQAAAGESYTFYFSADTMSGNVTFPVTYTVTIAQTSLPKVVIGEEAQGSISCSGGAWSYEFLVEASETGTYELCFKPLGNGLLRNVYNLQVNGVDAGQFQATNPQPADRIWRISIELQEGLNIIKIENASYANGSGSAQVTVMEKA